MGGGDGGGGRRLWKGWGGFDVTVAPFWNAIGLACTWIHTELPGTITRYAERVRENRN